MDPLQQLESSEFSPHHIDTTARPYLDAQYTFSIVAVIQINQLAKLNHLQPVLW
jgi:hypothetical protein